MSNYTGKIRGKPIQSAPPFDKPSRMRVIGNVKPVGYSLFECPSPLVSRQNRHFSKVSPLKSFADALISDVIPNNAAKEALKSNSNKEALKSNQVPIFSLSLRQNDVDIMRNALGLSNTTGDAAKAAPVSDEVRLLSPKLGHTGANPAAVVDDSCSSFIAPNPFPDELIRDIECSVTTFGNVDVLIDEEIMGNPNLNSRPKDKADHISSNPPTSADRAAPHVTFGTLDPIVNIAKYAQGVDKSLLGPRPPTLRPRFSAAEKGKGHMLPEKSPGNNNLSPPSNLSSAYLPYVGYKLQFDHDGQDIVQIDDEEILTIEEAWGFSLLGFFVGNTPAWWHIKDLQKRWGVQSVLKKEKGWLVFSFNSAQERDEVLFKGPYVADRRLLVLKPVPYLFNFDKDDLSSIPTWIKLTNLPTQFWTPTILAKLGSRLGNPMFVDPVTESKDKKAFARLLVDMNCKNDCLTSISLARRDGSIRVIGVEYENLPFYCPSCKIFGHDLMHCKLARNSPPKPKTKKGNLKPTPTTAKPIHLAPLSSSSPAPPKPYPNFHKARNPRTPPFSEDAPNLQEWRPIRKNTSSRPPPLTVDHIHPPSLVAPTTTLTPQSDSEPPCPSPLNCNPVLLDPNALQIVPAVLTDISSPPFLVSHADVGTVVSVSGMELALPSPPKAHSCTDLQIVCMQENECSSPILNRRNELDYLAELTDSSSTFSIPSQVIEDTTSDDSSTRSDTSRSLVIRSNQQGLRRSSRLSKLLTMRGRTPLN